MCGILAVINGEKIEDIIDTNSILKKRGPDSGNILIEKNCVLLFRRLAIMDVNSIAEQPFVTNNSKLMCNGEIYNFTSLQKKYDLHCRSNSDCEVIIHLADKCGFLKTITLLDGVFSMIYITNDKVYFARDYIGVRPLFYGITNKGGFALSSTALSLQKFCNKILEIYPGWGYYNRKEKTILIKRYNYPDLSYCASKILGFNKLTNKNENIFKRNLTKYIHNLLFRSIEKRLMGDRPLGCMLSGGLDSSLIVSILCKIIGAKNIKTFSIGIEGSEDLKNAKKVADFLGTNHTEILFTPDEGFEVIPNVIKDLESYDITTIRASVPMWLLSKYVSENTDIKILLSGEGADELFCGYLYFHYAPTPKKLHKESVRLVQELHLYDVLRADRCVSSHGLELRVPFLDKELVNLCLSLKGEVKQPFDGMEKDLLRSSFIDGYLPNSVLWRRKDGMSDGVSGNKGKRWYEEIQERVENVVTDKLFEIYKDNFPSKEALYYKKIFDKIFPIYQPILKYWLPKWIECYGDPSGRIMKVFEN